MTIKTRGIALTAGLALLTGLGIGTLNSRSALAVPSDSMGGSFSTGHLVSEKLRTSLSSKFKRRNKAMRRRGALAAFYSERDYQPLWITGGQLNERARKVMNELENAARYGLNPDDYIMPSLSDSSDRSIVGQLVNAELTLSQMALKYMRHANGERFDQSKLSRFLDRKAKPLDAISELSGLAKASDPAAYLVSRHPDHPQFKALVAALAESRGTMASKPRKRVKIPRGPVLKYGMKHPHIALVRQRLDVPVVGNVIDEQVYDAKLQSAVMAFQKKSGLSAEGVIGLKTRFALNAPRQNRYKQIIANMERWRWMPKNLGSTHIRVNIPEFKVRVVRNDRIIHEERVIVGKNTNKTPVFSDVMDHLVFNPYWNVPQSIIWGEMGGRIGKGFEGGTRNGRMWIRQLPGPRNALGKVKFMFPNKHAVYLHDTPQKRLFNKSRRAFSHGCVRVRNPRRLAEVIFNINGWSKAKADRRWTSRANTPVQLRTKIPVHLTYFTLWADKNGNLQSFSDVYGHDNRIYAAATKGVAYSKARFPEVRKKKIEPRVARVDDYDSNRYTNDWWFPSSNGSTYWSGHNTRQQKRNRVRVYRKQQKRKQAAFDDFFSLF